MPVYLNEFDNFAADWLQRLYPPATVDRRDIRDVQPADVAGFQRCHFFAGIGGWEYALELAGWPDDAPVWTGSCPCQPFSDAGSRQAEADERHVWPELFRLIAECRPAIVFGEQVASRLGREWLAGVRADLEDVGYEVGAADLCAAGVGAPHRRQQLYWMAYATGSRHERAFAAAKSNSRNEARVQLPSAGGAIAQKLGDATGERLEKKWGEYRPGGERCSGLAGFAMQAGVPSWNGPTVAVRCSDGSRRVSAQPEPQPMADGISLVLGRFFPELANQITNGVMAYARENQSSFSEAVRTLRFDDAAEEIQRNLGGLHSLSEAAILLAVLREQAGQLGEIVNGQTPGGKQDETGGVRSLRAASRKAARSPQERRFYGQFPAEFRDIMSVVSQAAPRLGEAKEVAEDALARFPLAAGVPRRVGKLRGAGNAIVPQLAAVFIRSCLEAINDRRS